MQKKANNMTAASSGVIRDSASSLKKTGSDSSLTNIKMLERNNSSSGTNNAPPTNTSTLPHPSSNYVPNKLATSSTLPRPPTTSSMLSHPSSNGAPPPEETSNNKVPNDVTSPPANNLPDVTANNLAQKKPADPGKINNKSDYLHVLHVTDF